MDYNFFIFSILTDYFLVFFFFLLLFAFRSSNPAVQKAMEKYQRAINRHVVLYALIAI